MAAKDLKARFFGSDVPTGPLLAEEKCLNEISQNFGEERDAILGMMGPN